MYCNIFKDVRESPRKDGGPEVHSKVVGYLTGNNTFGEVALLNQNSEKPTLATATVVAINKVCCFVLNKEDFLAYFKNNEYLMQQKRVKRRINL